MNQFFSLKSINIKSFRGLTNLEVNDLAPVNLILGSNNCGKTSFLEAIYLSKMTKFNDMRDLMLLRLNGRPNAEDVYFLYSRNDKKIDINYESSTGQISIFSTMKRVKTIFDRNIFLDNETKNDAWRHRIGSYINALKLDGKETFQYIGEYNYNGHKESFSYIPLDFEINSVIVHGYYKRNIVYVSPGEHFELRKLNLSEIIKNESYYKMFIQMLKMFDENIEDVLYLPDESLYSFAEIHVKCKNREPEPINIYGDGIKKAIMLAYSLLFAKSGILLIDELETSLHHSYLDDMFGFLLAAAKQFNIQLFITTHSDETIDELLKIGSEYGDDYINTYTLVKQDNKTYSRKLSGKEAINLRERIGYEVRG